MEEIGGITPQSDDLEGSKIFNLPSMSTLVLGASDSEGASPDDFEISMQFEDLVNMVPPEGVDFHASYDQVPKVKLRTGERVIHSAHQTDEADDMKSRLSIVSSTTSSRSQPVIVSDTCNNCENIKKKCTRIHPSTKINRSLSAESSVPQPSLAFSASPPDSSSKVKRPRAIPPTQLKSLQNSLQMISESISSGVGHHSDSELVMGLGADFGFRSITSSFSIVPQAPDPILLKEATHRRNRAMHHSFTVMPSESGVFSAAPLDVSNSLRTSQLGSKKSQIATTPSSKGDMISATYPFTNLTPFTPCQQIESDDATKKYLSFEQRKLHHGLSTLVDPVNPCKKNIEKGSCQLKHSSRRRPSRSKSASADCRLSSFSTASETPTTQFPSLDSLAIAMLGTKLKYSVSKHITRKKHSASLEDVIVERPRRKLVSHQSNPAASIDNNARRTPVRRKKSPDTARFRRSLSSKIMKDTEARMERNAKRKMTASIATATTAGSSTATGSSDQNSVSGSRYFVKSKSKQTIEAASEKSSTNNIAATSDNKNSKSMGKRRFRPLDQIPNKDDSSGMRSMMSLAKEQNSTSASLSSDCHRDSADLNESISRLHASVGRLSLDDSFSVSASEAVPRVTLLVGDQESFKTPSNYDLRKSFRDTIRLVSKWKRESELEDKHGMTSLGSLEGQEKFTSEQRKVAKKKKRKKRKKHLHTHHLLSQSLTSLSSITKSSFHDDPDDNQERHLGSRYRGSKQYESFSPLGKKSTPFCVASEKESDKDSVFDVLEAKEVRLKNYLTKTPETQRKKLDSYFNEAFKRNYAKRRSGIDETPNTPTTTTTFFSTSTA